MTKGKPCPFEDASNEAASFGASFLEAVSFEVASIVLNVFGCLLEVLFD
jgi:hypothetical protein